MHGDNNGLKLSLNVTLQVELCSGCCVVLCVLVNSVLAKNSRRVDPRGAEEAKVSFTGVHQVHFVILGRKIYSL